jgi:hypothetical protein
VCNPRGLTDLGRHFLGDMMDRGMMIDPDHMSVKARAQALDYLDSRRYSGVISSHSWADDPSYRRIYGMGGFVAAMKSDANDYLKIWHEHKKLWRESKSKHPFAMGFADDMNGFSSQPGPRDDADTNPLPYPFTSPVDDGVQVDRQITGERVFDLNEDGVDHFGLYADWIGDLKHVGGQRIIEDMAGATDAYLETWERAVGVPDRSCLRRRGPMRAAGYRKVRLNQNPVKLLKRAGQPQARPTRSYRYCVRGRENKRAGLAAVFTAGKKPKSALVVTDARTVRIGDVRPHARAFAVSRSARKLGHGLYSRRAGKSSNRYVFGVKGGKVAFVGVASRGAAKNGKSLRRYLKLGGFR